MKSACRHLFALLPALAVSCMVYDSALLQSGAESKGGSTGIAGGAVGAGSSSDGSGGSGGSDSTPGVGGEDPSGGRDTDPSAAGNASQSGGGGAAEQGGAPSGGGGTTTAHAGAGGSPATVELDLVDDFETPDIFGLNRNGRKPVWYLFNDMTTGQQAPSPFEMTELAPADAEARPGSVYVLYTTASGFSDWGSGVGIDLLNTGTKAAYDLSGYVGISFYAKAPGAHHLVRINVPDVGTDAEGGLCGAKCSDHFGKQVTLSDEWKRYDVLFEGMDQVGWGYDRDALTLDQVYSIHFQSAAGKVVELFVDDLSLIHK